MGDRVRIALVCEECKARNYQTTRVKTPGTTTERLSLKKFCKKCGKHTVHRETK